MIPRPIVATLTLTALAMGAGVAAEPFSGLSIGVDLTYAKYTARWDDKDYWWFGGSQDASYWGVLGGVHAAYDRQWDSLVLGIAGSIEFGDIRGSQAEDVDSVTGQARIRLRDSLNRDEQIRVRAGLAVERTLLYVMAGPAWVSTSHNWRDIGNPQPNRSTEVFHNQHMGNVIGIGVERIIAAHWSVNGDLFQLEVPDAAGSFGNRDHEFVAEKLTGVQLGLDYRF